MSSGGWGEGLMCWYEGMHWGQEDIWRLIETFILSGLLRQEHAGLDYKYLIIFRSSGGILVFIRGFSLDLTARIRVFPVTILIHYNRNARLHFSPSSDGSREKPLKRIFSLNFNLFSFFLVERNPKYCSFCHDDVNDKKLEELPYYSSSSHLSQSTQTTYVRVSCDLAGHRLMAGWDLDITQIFSFHRGTGSIITRGDWEQGRGGGGGGRDGWTKPPSPHWPLSATACWLLSQAQLWSFARSVRQYWAQTGLTGFIEIWKLICYCEEDHVLCRKVFICLGLLCHLMDVDYMKTVIFLLNKTWN